MNNERFNIYILNDVERRNSQMDLYKSSFMCQLYKNDTSTLFKSKIKKRDQNCLKIKQGN